MTMKIFEIPDKYGNITYRVQTPDGVWHNTDKEGNFLQDEDTTRKEQNDTTLPKESPRKGAKANLTLFISQEHSELLNEYIHWKCLYSGKRYTRSSFVSQVLLDAIRKDKDFREFRENRQPSKKESLKTLKIMI